MKQCHQSFVNGEGFLKISETNIFLPSYSFPSLLFGSSKRRRTRFNFIYPFLFLSRFYFHKKLHPQSFLLRFIFSHLKWSPFLHCNQLTRSSLSFLFKRQPVHVAWTRLHSIIPSHPLLSHSFCFSQYHRPSELVIPRIYRFILQLSFSLSLSLSLLSR